MTDPRELIAKSPMSTRQVLVVAITIALNALDGFDVLSISFASPGIAAEWKITRAALGFVLSMELIGMALGSIFLGSLADKIGRRPTVLGCLVVMATGMFMATTSNRHPRRTGDAGVRRCSCSTTRGRAPGGPVDVAHHHRPGHRRDARRDQRRGCRVLEYRRRDLNVAIMSIGYPVGAALGGFITSTGLELAEWRSVLYFGATVTVAMIPTCTS